MQIIGVSDETMALQRKIVHAMRTIPYYAQNPWGLRATSVMFVLANYAGTDRDGVEQLLRQYRESHENL